jgi:glutaminyl-tRNA synthetase
LTKNVYIESDDFSAEKKDGFFGVMPDQVVCLRYGPFIKMTSVVRGPDGKIVKVLVEEVTKPEAKVKGVIQWVSKEHSISCRVNQYNVLLLEEDALAAASKQNCEFTKFLNPDSLIVRPNAKIWDLHKDAKVFDRFQFERVGYFCMDMDSKSGNFIFNSIVALKESSDKKKNTAGKK